MGLFDLWPLTMGIIATITPAIIYTITAIGREVVTREILQYKYFSVNG